MSRECRHILESVHLSDGGDHDELAVISGATEAEATQRFIDLAHHGGCSQKCDAARLSRLLAPFTHTSGALGPDAGLTQVGERVLASSVDVVLPMVDDPALFGRIVTAHVLSDLYAVGASPLFGLNVLGLPGTAVGGINSEVDERIREMLSAANEALEDEGATCAGGHTISFDVLFFGMAVTGEVSKKGGIGHGNAQAGDCLVLTKPLGVSVATKAWKMTDLPPEAFPDVLEGMLCSNRTASKAMLTLDRCACTDISGFGLLGHLHNLLVASGVAATVNVDSIPVYATARDRITADSATRILDPNLAFVDPFVSNLAQLDEADRLLLADAQISGGLLVAVARSDVAGYLAALREGGGEGWIIGDVIEGGAGTVTLA